METQGAPTTPNELASPPHTTPADAVLGALHSDRTRGLPAAEVSKRLARYGRNQLAEAAPVPLWKKLIAQFKE
jgi:Ca2+-transporting ATPase